MKDPNWEKGGLMRVLIDRDGPLNHAVYAQRTACERISSQALTLGIDRPKGAQWPLCQESQYAYVSDYQCRCFTKSEIDQKWNLTNALVSNLQRSSQVI